MSTTETTGQPVLLCPGCGGAIETTQTLCIVCRSGLEEHVLAVRAAEYPSLFQNVMRNSPEAPRNPLDPTSMDMLKVAEQTSDDLDLVPLVPMDEPRRAAGDAGAEPAAETPADTYSISTSSAMAAAMPLAASSASSGASAQVAEPRPIGRPAQTMYGQAMAPRLEPTSRWKHVVIAVVCLAGTAVLAMVLWSVLVPRHPSDADGDLDGKRSAPAPRAAPKS